MADIRIIPSDGLVNVTGSINFKGTGGSTMLFMTGSSGNVGIGTTSSTYKLSVHENVNSGLLVTFRNPNTGTGQYTEFKLGQADASEIRIGSAYNYASAEWNQSWIYAVNRNLALKTPSGYHIRFYAGGTTDEYERMRVDSGGNIGIGTTSPAGKLSISTPNAYDGTILQLQSRDEPTAYNLKINEVVTSGVVRWSFDMTNSSAYNNTLVFDRGCVGIGVTNPSQKLEVTGNIYATGYVQGSSAYMSDQSGVSSFGSNSSTRSIRVGRDGTANDIFITGSSGHVGIGSATPKVKLDVAGAGGKIAITNTGTTDYSELMFYEGSTVKAEIWVNGSGQTNYAGANSMNIWQGSNAPMAFYTNGTNERMRIAADGNVGIGTDAPTNKLQVAGGVTATSFVGPLTGNASTATTAATASTFNGLNFNGITSRFTGDLNTLGLSSTSGIYNIGAGYTNGPGANLYGTLFGIWNTDISVQFWPTYNGDFYWRKSVGPTYSGGWRTILDTVNYNSYTPTLTGTGASGTWAIAISGNAATATTASFATTAATAASATNATNATNATYINVTEKNDNVNYQVLFSTANGTGNQAIYIDTDDAHLTYNPSSRTLSSATFVGNLTGNADTATSATSAGSATTATTAATASSANDFYVRGSLGVGTASPSYKLDVSGQIRVNNGVGNGSGQALIVGGSGDVTLTDGGSLFFGAYDYGGSTYIRGYDGGDIMYFYSNGTNMGYFRSDRAYFAVNTGIGTSSPSTRLHVSGGDAILRNAYIGEVPTYGAANSQFSHISRAGAGEYSFLSDSVGETYVNAKTGYNIYFRNNNNNLAIITSTGNVGIGTVSPTQLLEGYTSTNGDISIQITNPSTGASATAQFFASNGTNRTQFFHTGTSYNGTGVLASAAGLGGIYNNTAQGIALLASSAAGPIKFATTTSNTERMRIASDGNVGIGSTSPGKTLDVVGAIRASTAVSASAGIHIKSDGSADTSWDALTFRGTTEWGDASAYGVLGGDASEGIMLRRPHIVWSSVQSDAAIRLGRSGGSSGGDWFGVGVAASNVFFIRRSTTTNSVLEVDTNGNMALGAGSDYLYVRQGGNVGVGTTNPSNKFQVVGGVTATSFTGSLLGNASTATSASFATTAATAATATSATTATTATTATNVAWTGVTAGRRTNYDLGFEAPSTGYAGFSFTSPGGAAENAGYFLIRGGADNDVYTQNGITLVADAGWLTLAQRTTAGKGVRIMTGTTSVERVTVLEGGNVGIGTTTPSQKLHVNGSTYLESGNLFLTQGNYITWNSGDNFIKGISGYHLQFTTYDGSAAQVEVLRLTGGTAASGGARVGIGTSVPIAKLHVSGSSGSLAFNVEGSQGQLFSVTDSLSGSLMSVNDISGLPILEVFSDDRVIGGKFGSNALSISGSNVGIGAYNPARKLDVYDAASQIVAQFSSSNATSVRIKFSDANTGAENVNIGAIGTRMALWTNNTERVSILSGGSVGIGITNPAYKLDVVGGDVRIMNTSGPTLNFSDNVDQNWDMGVDASLNDFYIKNGISGVRHLTVKTGGNVGIGTTSPLFNLQVGANAGTIATTTIRLQNSYLDTNGYYGFNIDAVDNGVDGHDLRFLGRTSPTSGFSELVRIKNGGNVGIGTVSPQSPFKLDVVGPGRFNYYIRLHDGSNPWDIGALFNYTNSDLFFSMNGSEKMRVNANGQLCIGYSGANATGGNSLIAAGNVGIGTTSPSSQLHINTAGSSAFRVTRAGASTYGYEIGGTTFGVYDYTNSVYRWRTDGNNVILAESNGNVGIGTTNPGFKLDVSGSIRTLTGYIQGANSSADITIDGNIGTLLRYGTQKLLLNSSNAILYTADAIRLFIDNAGLIGIGTTSPTQLLHIQGANAGNNGISLQNTNASGNSQVRFLNTSGTERAAITYVNSADAVYHYTAGGGNLFNLVGGNVGIGTATPAVLLHLYGSGNTFTRYTNTSNSGHYVDIGANSAGESFIYGYGAYPVLFGTNGSEKMRILSNGNVGIGTTAPTHLLHVSGGGIRIQGTGNAANSLRFDDTGGTSRNAMYVSSSNYLVVGNSNYAGLQLIHTGSAPARYDGNNIDGYYGDTDGGRSYMSGPDNWLAVRINNTNFVIPMYQV